MSPRTRLIGSVASGSPGFDAGPLAEVSAGADLAGLPRIACGGVDMGAYENQDCEDARFLRGETNGDGTIDLSDALRTLDALFLGGPPLACAKAADTDDSGALDLTDAVHLLGWLFLGSPAPPEPFVACGQDPTSDVLDCALPPACLGG